MSLVRYKAQNHPQQVGKRGADPKVDDRATHPDDFARFDARFHFTIDVAASAENTKCFYYYDLETDGLKHGWARQSVWCNPPWSNIRPWVEKAWQEWESGTDVQRIIMLLPSNRTEQKWWQELVEPRRDRRGGTFHTEFLPGRMRFIRAGQTSIGPNERPPSGCVLLIWEGLL